MDRKEMLQYSPGSKNWKSGALKSVWNDRYSTQAFTFICPLCKRSRRLPYQTQPGGLKHCVAVGLTTVVFMLFTWNWFNWKGAVAFVPFWSLFELTYRWRTRAALFCKDCGFDPYLLKVSLKTAQREVEAHWRKKFEDKGVAYPEKKPLRYPEKRPQKGIDTTQERT